MRFFTDFFSIINIGTAKLRCGGGGAQRPHLRGNEPKKMGAHSAADTSQHIQILYICVEDVRFAMQGHHMGFAFSDGG
jgi:hypothetical protein